MKRKRYTLALTAGIFCAIALSGWILDRSGVFVSALRPKVVIALSQATGRDVTVGSMDGGFFGSIVLRDVTLGYSKHPSDMDAAVKVKDATVRFSLWDYFVLKKDVFLCLRSLDLNAPDISLRILKLPSEAPSLSPGDWPALLSSLPFPPLSTLVSDGRVSLSLSSTGQSEPIASDLNAELSTASAGGQVTLQLDGRAYGAFVRLHAALQPGSSTAQATLDFRGLDLVKARDAGWVPPGLPDFQNGSATGSLKLNLSKSLSVQGNLHVSELQFEVPSIGDLSHFEADLQLDNHHLGVENIRFQSLGASWLGRGDIADLSHPEFTLYVASNQGRPSWGGLSPERARLSLKASPQSLELQGLTLTSGAGSLTAAGIATFGGDDRGTLNFGAEISQFPVPALSAVMDGNMLVQGDIASPVVSAGLRCPTALIKGLPLKSVDIGFDSEGNQGSLTLQADWQSIQGIQLAVQGSPRHSHFRLGQADLGWLTGTVSTDFKSVSLTSTLDDVDVSLLAAALGLEANLQQTLTGSLKLQGPLENPDLDLDLDGRKLMTEEGQAFPLTAHLRIEKGILHLDRLNVRGNEMVASGEGDNYSFHFQAANLEMASVFVPESAGHLQGFLNGTLGLRRDHDDWLGDLDFDVSNLDAWGMEAKALRVQATAGKGQWKIKDLVALQKGGGQFQGNASFDPVQAGEASAVFRARNWKVAGRTLNLDLNAAGKRPGRMSEWLKRIAGSSSQGGAEMTGDFVVGALGVDARALPEVDGGWKWFRSQDLELQDIVWGPGVHAQGNWSAEDGWNASLTMHETPWERIAILAGLNEDAKIKPLPVEIALHGKGRQGDGKLNVSPGMQAALQWAPDASGAVRLTGSASVSDFDLTQALEMASLWAGTDFRDQAKSFSGHLNASLSLDTARAQALSFTANVDSLRDDQDDIWGPVTLDGSVGQQGVALDHASVGGDDSRLTLQNVVLQKGAAGNLSLTASYEAQHFPNFLFVYMNGQGSLTANFDKDGGSVETAWQQLRLNRQDFDPGKAMIRWNPQRIEASEPMEPSRWDIVMTRDKGASWTLESMFAGLSQGGEITAKDEMDTDGSPRLEVSGSAVPSSLIAALLDWPLELGGMVYGNATFRIPKDPQGYLHMMLSAKVENGDLEGFPFDLATGDVELKDGVLNVTALGQPARVSRRNRFTAEVTGLVPLYRNDNRPLDAMDLDGRLISGNLGMIDFINIVDSASGTVTAEAHIGGTALEPEFNGKAQVKDGVIKFKRLLAPATELQAQIFVDQNQLQIVKLDARMGGAGQRIFVSQADKSGPAVAFEKWVISSMNLGINSGKAGVRLEGNDNYNFLSGVLVPHVVLGGTWDEPTFSGSALLSDANVFYPIQHSGPEVPPNPNDFSERVLWNMRVKTSGVVTLHSIADAGDLGISQNKLFKKLTRVEAVRVDVAAPDQGIALAGAGSDFGLIGRIKVLRGQLNILSVQFPINTDKDNYFDFSSGGAGSLSLWSSKNVVDPEGRNGAVDVNFYGTPGHIKIAMDSTDNAAYVSSDDPDGNQQEMARLIGLNSEDAAGVLSGIFAKQLVSTLGSKIFGENLGLDFDLKVPGLIRQNVSATVDADDNTLEGQQLVNVAIGGHIPQTDIYVNAGYDERQGRVPGDPDAHDVQANLDVPLSDKTKLEMTLKSDTEAGGDAQIGLSQSQDFYNYNPRQRYDEMMARKERTESPTPAPGPIPVLTTTVTPGPNATPSPTPTTPAGENP